MINIGTTGINWGGLLNKGFEVLQEKVFNKPKSTGPVAVVQHANDFTPVERGVPAWVVPAFIIVGALLFMKKRRR